MAPGMQPLLKLSAMQPWARVALQTMRLKEHRCLAVSTHKKQNYIHLQSYIYITELDYDRLCIMYLYNAV
jgi:hypothetical protein